MKNEKSCIASYYRQVSTNIKNRNKKLKPVLIAQAFGLFALLKLVPYYTLHVTITGCIFVVKSVKRKPRLYTGYIMMIREENVSVGMMKHFRYL